ncbi:type I-E CRISPR-associated protein Cse2/CasB [Lactobacillus brevis] [Lactiplantibacillus mudanjiangensis]|uniref:type I-E CRISPR-associated protein Cse2/CasB n=1 Tax=Lactiplantibacillus mudanjiangensis TaxID=1296538 RepID=UPI0010154C02|nr:type I-E CRISPR-associated protein Cse2/CasB [Lactiplantibacillus mudanjiangensis]VDG20944.1 type I-E CRISPR-associated protein Cse2/CasB [Lactobacillus brevis] [Lactiplantibacillus mudanjiangensis]VDG31928.1 type I-E CRISPR-associated protein Cse2/CasB [Lactobacillus brevis] [Lactiplantibacillus mudanjiangensis]
MEYEIKKATDQIIKAINCDHDGKPNKAVLAGLRKAASITSPHAQIAWPLILAHLNEKDISHTGAPTSGEIAVYTAIHFYAIHQQGLEQSVYVLDKDAQDKDVQDSRLSFFKALAELSKEKNRQTSVNSRVQLVLATTDTARVINILSQLVRLLRSAKKQRKIDYAMLAQDIYGLQGNRSQADRIRWHWGEQYFRNNQVTSKDKGDQNND